MTPITPQAGASLPPKHTAALAWATKHIGEREDPPGSNTGTFVKSCQAATWLPGTRWPWCVAFWIKAWTMAGYTLPYRGAGAYAFLDYHRTNLPGWIPKAFHDAKPGAAVIFSIGAGHLAMLAKPIAKGDTTVTTIGGNERDAVRQDTRPLAQVRGIVDPPEFARLPVPPPPPAKPNRWEVATSISGKRKLIYASGANAISRKIGQILNRWGGITITPKKAA